MRQWALRLLVFPPWVGSAQRKLDDQSESEHSSASARVRRVGQVCPLSFVWGRASGSVDGFGFASCLFTPFFSRTNMKDQAGSVITVGCRVAEADDGFGDGTVESITVPVGGAIHANVGILWDTPEKGGPGWSSDMAAGVVQSIFW